jgi:hypothetical protein
LLSFREEGARRGTYVRFIHSGIDALERAVELRSGSRSVLSMKINPGYDFIRDDEKFVALMKKSV